MASRALDRWLDDRSAALGRLERVHGTTTGGLSGRPRDVTELNHALFLRLAAEVQGFCRDQHEATDAICTPVQVPSPDLRAAFRARLLAGRKLDAGNAGPGNVGSDWAHFGTTLWPDLVAAHPGRRGATDWNSRLEWLNTARNGIAHNDPAKIAVARTTHPLTINTFRVMRRRFNKFAPALDRTTEAYFRSATGVAPW